MINWVTAKVDNLSNSFCAKKKNNLFVNPAKFQCKNGHFVSLCCTRKNFSWVKNKQVRDVTVLQKYSNVESTYNSVVIIFVLAVALSKNRLKLMC